MSKLPNLSGKDVAKKLEKIDFVFVRQSGSHMNEGRIFNLDFSAEHL